MTPQISIVFATTNQGKLRELRFLLRDMAIEVLSSADVGAPHVEEDGDTFEENAVKKATEIARATCHITVADDSGLEVDALSGRPGVWSARYAGDNASAEMRNQKLLGELSHVPDEQRSARFRCVLSLVDPFHDYSIQTSSGICEGFIAQAPCGQYGFGYDPVFWIPEFQKTMAELPEETKNKISHRARAMADLKPKLQALLTQR